MKQRSLPGFAICVLLAFGAATACVAQGESDPTGFIPVAGAGGGVGGEDGSAQGGSSGEGGEGQGGIAGDGGSAQGGASGQGATAGSAGSGASSGSAGKAGSAGSGGSSGKGGTAGAAGKGGTAGAGGCVDTDPEPNDTEASAFKLAGITDCDSTGSSLAGTINGKSDSDWYTVFANDGMGCSVTPTFTISPSGTFTVCAYFACDGGGTEVTCDSASTAATSPAGNSGCCSTAASFAPGVNCAGTLEDSTQISIEVKSTKDACQKYTLDYNY